jgi:DNA-binding NtrC family response regulator
MAATHRNLPKMVADGAFREDLYFRLRVMEIHLPPLRERDGDIPQLAEMLLEKSCQRLHKPALTLDPRALDAMQAYRWPGNVREMENAIERAVILCEGDTIGAELLALDGTRGPSAAGDDGPDGGDGGGDNGARRDLSLEEYFKAFVEEHQGEMTETQLAERLGISRKALWERRQRLGIPKPR